ncbi:NPC intracellular cholesterol transporter 2 homolog a-like [Ctenocephalides felis]|uniref:NPC intracellular cholesterol transporter 2 homolog a-like n=1 Tax=Ctenocephalides felis TaxID=7515 RepID=UPI000E6E4FF8|nr:NPC intracellular cholesterol transporter 2 homolog a-like [Ctenocephalides felis]
MRALIVLAIIVPFAVQATTIAKCDNGAPLPTSVDVEGCDKLPCPLVRGSTSLTDVKFTVPADSATLKPEVKAKVAGVTVPYPLAPELSDACQFLKEGSCPLKKDDKVTYNLKVPVLQSYPAINLDLMVSLVDDSAKPVLCFKIPCKVV